METIEGQLAYIEQTLKQAQGNTTGHTQQQIIRSLQMFAPLKSSIQNLRARVSKVDEE